ncbi:hypothetical protein RUND412_010836 [Rhizina undulata]
MYTYDPNEDIVLTDASNNRPTAQSNPYICVHVGRGDKEEVWFLNSKKFSEGSSIGRVLCENLANVPREGYYRYDLLDENPDCVANMVEFINCGYYRTNTEVFRMSLQRQLDLYSLSLRLQIPGLTKLVLQVVGSMLCEAHPEHVARPILWLTIEKFHENYGKNDQMRDLLFAFPTSWYPDNGRYSDKYKLIYSSKKLTAREGIAILAEKLRKKLKRQNVDDEKFGNLMEFFKVDAGFHITRCWKNSIMEGDKLFSIWATYCDDRNEAVRRGTYHKKYPKAPWIRRNAKYFAELQNEDKIFASSAASKKHWQF